MSSLAGVVLLALWAMSAAGDYSTGMIRILVQAQPNRVNLLTGKIIALALFTLLATASTTLVVVLVSRPLARLQGIETKAWKTDFFAHLLSGYVNFTIAALVWGLIGLMIAVLTKSSALAIGIGIGYLLVVESLIGIIAPEVDRLPPRRHPQRPRLRRNQPTRLDRRARPHHPLRHHRHHRLARRLPRPRHHLLNIKRVHPIRCRRVPGRIASRSTHVHCWRHLDPVPRTSAARPSAVVAQGSVYRKASGWAFPVDAGFHPGTGQHRQVRRQG